MKGFVATVFSFALAFARFTAAVILAVVDVCRAPPQASVEHPAPAFPDIHKLLRPPIV